MSKPRPIRVLYSFPHKIGAGRICSTAWHQVAGLAEAGASVTLFTGSLARPLPRGVAVMPTFARGPFRVPYRLLGETRALRIHDHIVARRLRALASEIDIIHLWPLGALETLEAAALLGIPTVLERPNAHTRYAYEVVRAECARLGVDLPPDHEHAYNSDLLAHEEREYRLARKLLCPSDFVMKTFLDEGYAPRQLARHFYGYDPDLFFPDRRDREARGGLTMLFVGVAAVRKGVHYALEAWLRSSASRHGTFMIAGDFLPAYADHLTSRLDHPSIKVLGHRTDIPLLMRSSDILVLPSIEEGSALVCGEALGSGCALLVSDASTGVAVHGRNALVHAAGDVAALTRHMNELNDDRGLLRRLRTNALDDSSQITWSAAGRRLLDVYRSVIFNGAETEAA